MSQSEKLIFGPPGCGKTYTLINIVKQELANGTPPDRIGFVSFSKKSISEAILRAGSELGLEEKHLPWFRTLHSIGHRWLGFDKEKIMGYYDFQMFGYEVGMVFDSSTAAQMEDGLVPMSHKEGNKYLEIIARSAMRCISLEDEFNSKKNYDIHWEFLVSLDKAYKSYKKRNERHDYTDMISKFVLQGTAPTLDVLIVDEAQDLTPLQWKQVAILKQHAERVWYAGDDDQCIHKWNGVDVGLFLKICPNIEILKQSYRVPKSVFRLAKALTNRIDLRQQKDWNPMDREGDVIWHSNWHDIDIEEGSWTIMGRTNKIVSGVARQLRDDGYLFRRNGKLSFDEATLKGMNTWKALSEGREVILDDVKELYKLVPKRGDKAVIKRGASKSLDTIDPQATLTYDLLVRDHGLIADKSASSQDVCNLSYLDRIYLASILRRGSLVPRITVSTIHRMKGGEDDNVMLFTESCYPAVSNTDQDEEHRVFYTGVTRTKHNLHIVDGPAKYRYQI